MVLPDFAGFEVFLRVKPVRALVLLANGEREWYASGLAKEADCTFPHIIKILSLFEGAGLVSFRPDGRKKIISLTPKGKKLASHFISIAELV